MTRLLAAAMALLVTACAPGGGNAGFLVEYQRTWPDGRVERTTVHPDGRVEMSHGGNLERFTVSAAEVERLRTALESPITTGDEGPPERLVRLAGGIEVRDPAVVADGAVEMLDRLTETHRLVAPASPGAPAAGSSPRDDHPVESDH